jgi:hypothetical protein
MEESKPVSEKQETKKSEIVYDDFAKLDLRVGTVTSL